MNLLKRLYSNLGNYEKKIPWNKVFSVYEIIFFLYLLGKISIFLLGFFIPVPNLLIEYSKIITNILNITISIYLIVKFGPWSKSKFNNKEKSLLYEAGLFLFASTILGQFIEQQGKLFLSQTNIYKT